MSDEDQENTNTEAGHRDLDYGNVFGTQRDRSSGNETDYVENYSERWIDALPDVERDDAGLERAVKERLNGRVDDARIDVKEGVVTLQGSVESAEIRDEVARTVRDMSGVKEVRSELETR